MLDVFVAHDFSFTDTWNVKKMFKTEEKLDVRWVHLLKKEDGNYRIVV